MSTSNSDLLGKGSDNMKHVMMIARFFPPEGSATSFRTLRFVRQLVERDWKTTVVTATPSQYERYDAKLVDTVPPQTRVIPAIGYDRWQQFQSWRARRMAAESVSIGRAEAHPAEGEAGGLRTRLRSMVRGAEACWYQPDVASPWIAHGVNAGLAACAQDRPNILWANAGRLSAFYIAQQLSDRTGIPYVLDFDDAWSITSNDHDARRPRWATRELRRRMHGLLHGAHAVVFRYESEAECFWRAYPGALQASKIYIIPNGFEAPIEPFMAPTGDRCTILYSGTLPDYRYDTLLLALTDLKASYPAKARQLRLRFIGEGMGPLAAKVEAQGLTDLVDTSGPIPFDDLARLQRGVHALLVLGRPSTMKGHELFAGAKLFGYLKAGRPILGVLPQDETKHVLLQVGTKTVANVDSVQEITAVLLQMLDAWLAGDLSSLAPDRKACEAYSSEQQTAILIRAFEGVPSEKPFIPGAQPIPASLREIEDPRWLNGDS